MPDQIYIGNFTKGLTKDRLPFNIDNDAFPTLANAYSWRGRIKRKRGTSILGRLQRQVKSVSGTPLTWQYPAIAPSLGYANLFVSLGIGPSQAISITNIILGTTTTVVIPGSTYVIGNQVYINYQVGASLVKGYFTVASLTTVAAVPAIVLNFDSTASTAYVSGGKVSLVDVNGIVPGSVQLTDNFGNVFTEPGSRNGTLIGTPSGTGLINYPSGLIFLSTVPATVTGTFSYYPNLPVLGLRDFSSTSTTNLYPILLAFDQKYSYQTNGVNQFYSTSYYKVTNNPVIWSAPDYAQFWTCNYAGALWATNNKPSSNIILISTIVVGAATTITTSVPNGLVVGDYVWFNEVTGVDAATLNGQTAQITVRNSSTSFDVAINTTALTIDNSGIIQALTSDFGSGDGIRWYDGDPTGGTGLPTGSGFGWVNFSPPLTAISTPIDNHPSALYYLIGALGILPFKDRLLFISPIIGTSSGTQITLDDTILWSWNGTPYYAGLVPINQTSNPIAYYVDQTGAGGYLPAGIEDPIMTFGDNEDVLLIGFGGGGRKTRFVYTGNDFQPFLFYNINSELPSNATFSAINMDKGMLDIGAFGLAMTDQQSSSRVDLQIPDTIFQIKSSENGIKRVNSVRDFFREWIYFTYPIETQVYEDRDECQFPLQSLLFNYRDNTWAILYENFTAHGTYRIVGRTTWQTLPYQTWNQWREPWNSGQSNELFPDVIAGNPQGYVLKTDEGTGESVSGGIEGIANDGNNNTLIYSKNHCVSSANPLVGGGDFLYIQGATGITSFTITNITTPGVFPVILTVNNTFTVPGEVIISGVVGMTELNGNVYEITDSSSTTLAIDVDTTGFTAYASGGTVSSAFNNQIAKVIAVPNKDSFVIDIGYPVNTYQGLGQYSRLCKPLFLTKQFPVYWEEGRQVRLSAQKYLLDTTQNSQLTLNIYLSQNDDEAWNNMDNEGSNNGLIYSQVLYTCPESSEIGLTPANTNLQMPTAASQFQIWHRYAESLVGNSFQIGFTLSEDQMRNLTYATDEIALHGIHLTCDRGPHLC